MTTSIPYNMEDQIVGRLLERLMNERFNMIEQQLDSMNSRMRELEANVRDISSIKGAVQRMNVGFQEIPYELNGRAAVEEIKDYY
uniref:hypothetical protein n=1 Tax=Candidatus Electrothrix sp. TaxID=2170559 RepID=UPI00405710C1